MPFATVNVLRSLIFIITGSIARISVTHGAISGVFDPKGRHVAPLGVKYGVEESITPYFTAIGVGVGRGAPKTEIFTQFISLPLPFSFGSGGVGILQ